MKRLRSRTAVVIASGVTGDTYPEDLLNGAIVENSLDLVEMSSELDSIDLQVLVSNSDDLINRARGISPKITIEKTDDDFHFGRKLYGVIEGYGIENLLYIGGGTGLLLERADLDRMLQRIISEERISISNNFYSTDFFGVSPAGKMLGTSPPRKDNLLGWKSRDAGFKAAELERNAKTQVDVDSPGDLIPLREFGTPHKRLGEYLSSLDLHTSSYHTIKRQLTQPEKRLVVAGRIGASTWSYLEKNAACHVDVYSEGRGSYAVRRDEEPIPSLLGSFFDRDDPKAVLEVLLSRGTGLLLDTRIIFNFHGNWPSRSERFWADLLRPEELKTPYLKDLTEAILELKQPVIPGGHSLVSGALYLMVDKAWRDGDVGQVNVRPVTIPL
ncbi:MAG: hypothetical protein ACLFVS_00020 [Candidatus Acetothermia bacterium]